MSKLTPGTVEYVQLHHWVESKLGKPQSCEECGRTTSKKYEWANISQEYKRELSDWKRLCSSCHRKFDLAANPLPPKTHCVNGHEMTPENTYIRLKPIQYGIIGNYTECKICRAAWRKKYNKKEEL